MLDANLIMAPHIKSVAILFDTSGSNCALSALKSVNVAGAVIPLSAKLRSLVLRWMPTSPRRFTLRLYQAPAFITFVISGKFVHR